MNDLVALVHAVLDQRIAGQGANDEDSGAVTFVDLIHAREISAVFENTASGLNKAARGDGAKTCDGAVGGNDALTLWRFEDHRIFVHLHRRSVVGAF